MYEFYDNMYIGNISTVETKLIDSKNVKKFFFFLFTQNTNGEEKWICVSFCGGLVIISKMVGIIFLEILLGSISL